MTTALAAVTAPELVAARPARSLLGRSKTALGIVAPLVFAFLVTCIPMAALPALAIAAGSGFLVVVAFDFVVWTRRLSDPAELVRLALEAGEREPVDSAI